MSQIKIPIKGMHCASCEILVGENLKKLDNVSKVVVDQSKAEAVVHYKQKAPSPEAIRQAVKDAGYDVGTNEALPWISKDPSDYKDLLKAALILSAVYFVGSRLNLFSLDVGSQNAGVGVALLVGLVAGVSTCMALIGGLVLSLSARHAELHPEATSMQKFRPHLFFNLGRILGYALLGGVVGIIGVAFKPSTNILGLLTMVIGGVMIFFGLKLIEIFPVLKNKSITLPSGLAKVFGLNKEIKEYSPKSAMLTGALTFFLPCGFTQAMQLYAVSTGSFVQGATIMGLFAIGTAPGLLSVGGLTSVFKGKKAKVFFMTAGLAVLVLGWTNLVNGKQLIAQPVRSETSSNVDESDAQVVRMTQSGSGYSPNVFTVKKGKPVKWIINSTSQFSCSASIVMPKYGISESLRPGENIITFTPTETGEIPFSCSMGMYRGKFIVTDGSSSGATQSASQTDQTYSAPVGATCGGGGGGGCGGCGGRRVNAAPQSGQVSNSSETGEQVIQSSYTLKKDIVPNTFTVKKGVPVKYVVDVQENGYGCMSTIMVEGLYNNPQPLRAGNQIVMTFTPEETGTFSITCAMGVPRGTIKVVE
jgi:sulfite exporter TauE/SafE/copper chaperone CopZ